jgi:hypothetical protein
MTSIRSRRIIGATVVAAVSLTLSLVAGAGMAQATNATSAASVLGAINTARASHGLSAYRTNGYLAAYAQEIASVYAAHGLNAAISAKTADSPPSNCTNKNVDLATAKLSGSTAALSQRFTSDNFNSDNYASVGFVLKGSKAYAVFAAVFCGTSPNDKIGPGAVTLSGTSQVGKPLTAKVTGFTKSDATGPSDVASLKFEWGAQSPEGNFVERSSGAADSYTPLPSDVGWKIIVLVTATAPGYNAAAKDSGYSTPVKLGTLPTPSTQVVSGKRNVGWPLTASTSGWTSGSLVYQWYRDGKPIGGATGQSYMQVAADHGHKVTVRVICQEVGYSTASRTSKTAAKTAYPFLMLVDPVDITGIRFVGNLVSANVGAWSPTTSPITYTFQWYEGGKKVSGATHSTHTIGHVAGETNSISVAVTAHESHFTATTVVSPTESVAPATH